MIRKLMPLMMLTALAFPARADLKTYLEIVEYNLKFSGILSRFKDHCHLARSFVAAGQQTGQDGAVKAGEVMQKALAELTDRLDYELLPDLVQTFKSFVGSYGGPRYYVAGEPVFWVYPTNHSIKPYLLQGVQAMRAKLFTTANGNRSGKYTQMFKDIDVLEKLVGSIEAEDHVLRNREGTELKRQGSKQLPPVIDEEPAPMPPPAN